MFGCSSQPSSEQKTNDASTQKSAETQQAVDKTTLKSTIDRASSLDSSQYTADSYSSLSDALANAKAIYENNSATADEVSRAADDLLTSINKLNKTFLGTLALLSSFEEVSLSGVGDDVIDIPCAGIPCIIELTHDGSSNFAVKSIDANGGSVDLLVNEIGMYSGIVTTYFDSKDSAMLEINANGNWTATFKPLTSMQKAENGSTFTGDNVVYIDEGKLTKIAFSHDGSSNFAVKGVGLNSSKLLVNEIGAYNGTVAWNQPQSFFVVSADGNWTVSW